MDLTPAELHVMNRFAEKGRIAGRPRPGYLLRKRAICYHQANQPELDLEAALASLVARELLKVSDKGDLYFLASAGAQRLEAMNEGAGGPPA